MEHDEVKRQLEMNQQSWRALRQAGVREGQPLDIDFFCYAAGEQRASALRQALLRERHQAEVHVRRKGLLKRRTSFLQPALRDEVGERVAVVVGRTRLPAVSLPALDDLVASLVHRSAEHGAEFDGWGAEVAAT